MRATTPALLLLGLVACDDRRLEDHPVHAPTVSTERIGTIALDAVMPSDALLLADGSVLVLDGHGGKVLRVDADATSVSTFSSAVGQSARLAPAAAGGVWVTRPGGPDAPGALVLLDADGGTVGVRAPVDAQGRPLHPVDVLDRGSELLVADRELGLVTLNAEDEVVRTRTTGLDGIGLRRIVDLAPATDGYWLVDSLSPRLSHWTLADEPLASFGRPGLKVGSLGRPTSIAPVQGGVLVTDAVLGAVQAFDPQGTSIGALAVDGELARFSHTVAVRADDAGRVAVLEANPARLTILRVAPLPAAGAEPLLRTTLVAADTDPAGEHGASCAQCHDGLVLDGREVWDPRREHHPVDVVPEGDVPAFFPLDEQGRLTCRTCHSPHGVVDEAGDEAAPLVRHASATSPFTRLERDSDALCTACHGTDVHDADPASDRAPTGGGHPSGAALIAALQKRGASVDQIGRASCLSCHAVHGAASKPLMRSTDEASVCVGCHADQRQEGRNHPLGHVPGRDLARAAAGGVVRLSADGGVGCTSCHDLTSPRTSLLRWVGAGKPVCLECHGERSDLAEGAHRKLGTRDAPACISCHEVHGGDREQHFVATGPVTDADPRGCLSCHGKPGGSQGTPGKLGHPVDGRVMADGEHLDCLACHDPHAANRPSADDCADCHAEQGQAHDAGGHGRATCLDCHPAHGRPPGWTGSENPASARCLACHAESRARPNTPMVSSYEHPSPQFLPDGSRWTPLGGLTLFAPDGSIAPNGTNGELTCQTCHVVHGPDGGADHLRRSGGWQEACASCHGDDALILYRDFHDPERRGSLLESR
ncbi:MAG: hypothetical protein KC621_26715 [Myxococcales bacterium]|nr:hypothetical protein [Myxococcales bacterium]